MYLNRVEGSYVMMDADYCRNLAQDGNYTTEFLQSLFVLSTVQSASVSIILFTVEQKWKNAGPTT